MIDLLALLLEFVSPLVAPIKGAYPHLVASNYELFGRALNFISFVEIWVRFYHGKGIKNCDSNTGVETRARKKKNILKSPSAIETDPHTSVLTFISFSHVKPVIN